MANIKGRWPKSLSPAKCHLILQSTSLESARGGQIDGRLLALRPRRVAVSSKPCISPSQFASSARPRTVCGLWRVWPSPIQMRISISMSRYLTVAVNWPIGQ